MAAATAASSVSLRFRFVILVEPTQVPLISTEVFNQTARDADLQLISVADSSQKVTEFILRSKAAGSHTVLAQSQDGYTMFHGKPEGDGLMVLCPSGSVPLLNDSAAQICVMGKNFMYTLPC